MKKSGFRWMILWGALILVPLVIVIPGFQHICLGTSEDTPSESCCSIVSVDEFSCCCSDEDSVGCGGCNTQVTSFSFINKTVIPSGIDIQPMPVIMAMFSGSCVDSSLLVGLDSNILELYPPPVLCYNRLMQCLFCVFIC